MVYTAKGATAKSTAAPAPAATGEEAGWDRGITVYNLKFLASGAIEGEDGKLPWVQLCCIRKRKCVSQTDKSEYYSFSGDSFPPENDPENQDRVRYKLKADADGPFLECLPGKRVKKSTAKSKDGREFTQIGDTKTVHLRPVVTDKGKTIPKAFVGEDEDHNTYRLFEYHTKEEWEEIMKSKDKPKVSRAEAIF